MELVEMLSRKRVLPGDDLLHPRRLHQPEGGGELADAEVQARDGVIGLAVVAIRASVREQLLVSRHQHAALARRDRLGRVERADAGVAEAARPPSVPPGAVCVRAILEQEDAVVAAVARNALALEREVAADVDEHRGARATALGLRLEVRE